ncbi:PAS domain-containing protein, partial [archaeon]
DKKKAEQELEVLSTVASKTHTGVAICNQRGEITWVNKALENLIGYTRPELLEKKLGDVLSTEETDLQVITKAREASQHQQSFSIEVLAQKKNGMSIWLAVSNTPIINANGKVERYIELITDITDTLHIVIRTEYMYVRMNTNTMIDSTSHTHIRYKVNYGCKYDDIRRVSVCVCL